MELGPEASEQIVEIAVDWLEDHPSHSLFRQMTDEELSSLAESIAEKGFIHPLVVRPIGDNRYQVLSGRQRRRAAMEKLGLPTVPCVVAEMDDAAAEAVLLDANLEARHLSHMELARAIRRKRELMGERRGRPKANSDENHHVLGGYRELLARPGLSPAMVGMYDSLNELIPELQGMTDSGNLGITAAALLSRLPAPLQQELWELLGENLGDLTVAQVRHLKQERDRGAVLLEALTNRVQDLERQVGADDRVTEAHRELAKLRERKHALEMDIEDRLAQRRALTRRPGARVLELMVPALRPLAQARPELEALLMNLSLDGATAANLQPHLQMLQVITHLLEEAVAKGLPPSVLTKERMS